MKNIHMLPIRKLLILLGVLFAGQVYSQTTENESQSTENEPQAVENDFQSRTELKLSFSPVKKFRITFIPELRLDESFNIDKSLLETELSYNPIKDLSLIGSYRFIINPRDTKSTEYLHRFAFAADYSKSIKRWEPSFRIKYTNYTEDASNGEFLRYRAKLEYDIKNFKLTPYVRAEGFHDLEENDMYKMRYALGAKYKLNKKNSVKIGYMLDYYLQEYRNKHIITIGYSLKF